MSPWAAAPSAPTGHRGGAEAAARPVRVRAIYTRYPHWGRHSGMSQLLAHLDPARCTVDTHAASDNDDDLPVPSAVLRAWLRKRVTRAGMEWYKLSDLAAEARALPGCLLGRTDVVHFLDGEHSAQYLPVWLRHARRARTKVVATYHQMPDMLERLVAREVVAALDHVTLVSPAQLPYFQGVLPPERVEVVLHGVDATFFTPAAARRDDRIFTTITTGHWQRDWATVRVVAERLGREPPVVFHVVTDRPTGLDDLPSVVVHRRVDDATLLALYRDADCLFLPLLDSTANNSLLEGIACGLPVVSTSLPSVRAYLPGGEAILVERNDPGHLVAALDRLRRDPGLRTAMAVRARARAEALSWSRVARTYERLYTRLATGPRRMPRGEGERSGA
jgi:glycosyltransferase involved in cell wall biosynthesis